MSVRTRAFALIIVTLPAVPLAAQDADAELRDAMSAAPEEVAAGATVVDWDGNLLQEGTNGFTCYPTPPNLPGDAPMCLDETWVGWAEAWQGRTEPRIDEVGIAYMLAGDAGASNSDPYASDPQAVDDWVDASRHLMVLFPDPTDYDAFPTDPSYGGPWVMWKGTPYAHVMVPISEVDYEGETAADRSRSGG